MDLKYPKWQEPLATAILEFNPQQLPAKLQRAEEAIFNRIGELTFEKDAKEGRLLSDGLSIIPKPQGTPTPAITPPCFVLIGDSYAQITSPARKCSSRAAHFDGADVECCGCCVVSD